MVDRKNHEINVEISCPKESKGRKSFNSLFTHKLKLIYPKNNTQRKPFSPCIIKHASPVYELLGYKDLVAKEYPGVGPFLNEGRIGFRAHGGGHTVEPNWPYFIDFMRSFLEDDK